MESTVIEQTDEQIADEKKYEIWIPCDSCRVARAMWHIKGSIGELFFCGHHKNLYESSMSVWANEYIQL